MKARWDAQNVVPQNYKADMLAFLRTYLNDPTQVRDGDGLAAAAARYVGPGERYVACVRFNARNSDGKYVGIKDGRRRLRVGQARPLHRHPKELRERDCARTPRYAPFPELEKLTR